LIRKKLQDQSRPRSELVVCGKVDERPFRQLLRHLEFADLPREIRVGTVFGLACGHSFLKLRHSDVPRAGRCQRQGRDQTCRERASGNRKSRDRKSRNQPWHLNRSDLFPDALHGVT
jgi:hypothetical protein